MNLFISFITASSLDGNPMSTLDIILFLVSVIAVIAFGIRQGNKDQQSGSESQGAEGYFLAGRGLTWWLVGFSLIAANISTEQFVDWAVTNMQGELVVSGWGNRTIELPSTGIRIERDTKVKYSEYTYVVEVTSGNGDAFVSLTVDGDDEFLQTVACGRSGDPEVLYTHLNTGYGTKHWLVPGFMQGIPG